jgi:hypothetical protein
MWIARFLAPGINMVSEVESVTNDWHFRHFLCDFGQFASFSIHRKFLQVTSIVVHQDLYNDI